jgi:hypothetical protein
MYFTSGKLPQ